MATDEPELSVSDELIKLPVDSKSQKRSKSPSAYRKPCDLCHTPNDVLVRCQIEETCSWYFVCTKKCWRDVSGGIVDGDSNHPHYRYGGMWKNKHAGVSAKKPNPKRQMAIGAWQASDKTYVVHAKVCHGGKVWFCRRQHESSEEKKPGQGYRYWKEA